ncbi:MAG: type II toxin-antitoxin system VapC family toxin [Phycisphaerae bacterium]|nr:type II toxin-antitoxin system VapC family toxin [Phycisphaerae bacterium]
MVLVDTSVWVDHFRHPEGLLHDLLASGQVVTHPFVIGELSCGNLKNRDQILGLLRALPQAQLAMHDEVLHLVNSKKLHGKGLGWVDAHILASSLLSHTGLWTKDRRLAAAARTLHIADKK